MKHRVVLKTKSQSASSKKTN